MNQHAELLLSGGTLVTPNGSQVADIACRAGRIVAIGELGQWRADQHLNLAGLHVLPGVIDSQVHFRQPGLEHKETIEAGSRGAVLGGVTGFFEMPNTNPLTLSGADLQAKLAIASRSSWCDYAFYIGGSAANCTDMRALEQLPGCAGIKVFMGSSFGDLLTDNDEILRQLVQNGHRRMAVHAEDQARLLQRKQQFVGSHDVQLHPLWRDEQSALLATQKVVRMAEEAGRRLHVLHVSTAAEMELLAQHKRLVSVEVTPHHLTLTAPDCYQQLGTLAQMNPPIREQRHQDALWAAINNGLVDVIGSDHAPHTLREKQQPWPDAPSGMTGVQTLLPIMLDHVHAGRLTLQRLVDLTSAGPARIFGLAGKGRLAVGYDADFSIVDLQARRTISSEWITSLSGWTPYDGRGVTGWPIHTIIRGQAVVLDESLCGQPAGRPIQFLETALQEIPS
ncbi:dihydroorotase [Oceanobacter mangrovi]|uniref:dihydroorotase n=1 Tax=Oceanobacter mangrovi TaxID=2862510 RepID=UPI001C8DDBB2|nr:dihydroorotase [Oceanobacter mangrovi]